MKIIFMGTPEFAVPTLDALVKKHDVMAVVTQPDKPKGRGKKRLWNTASKSISLLRSERLILWKH